MNSGQKLDAGIRSCVSDKKRFFRGQGSVEDGGAHAGDVIFTSGGTEADNLAVKGIALAQIRRERETRAAAASASTPARAFTPASASPHSPAHRILISAVEHPAVAQSAQWLHDFFDFEVVRIPVDTQAHIDLNVLSREAQKGATLACIMMANNEVGTIEPVSRAVRICHDAAAGFFRKPEIAAVQNRTDILGGGTDQRHLEVMNGRGPVHGHGRDHLCLNQRLEHRLQAALDHMPADGQYDRTPLAMHIDHRIDLVLAQLQKLGAGLPAGQDKPDDFDPNYLNKIVD